jgi:hypothetical protein
VKGNIGPKADTGRPGREVAVRQTSTPSLSPSPPAGYEPGALDKTISSYIGAAERSIRIAESLSRKVETAVTALATSTSGLPEDDAELMTRLHERLSKACLNLVKSTDELTRLRSFLAGGPDSRPDLTVRGEIELRSLLVVAVKQLGWRVTDADGKPIAVEAA